MCLYCGLESPVATNHANTDECISALRRELYRLTERLLHKRLNRTALSSPAREPEAAPARTSCDPSLSTKEERLASRRTGQATQIPWPERAPCRLDDVSG
jgi:hypothetical protein